MADEQRPLHVLISVDLYRRLEQMAKQEQRSKAAEVRRALEAHLHELEREEVAA